MFLYDACPQEKITCWSFIRTYVTWGKGNTQLYLAFHLGKEKYPTQAPSSHPFPPNGRRDMLRSTSEVHRTGSQAHQKITHLIIEHSLSPHLTTTSQKFYLPQFPLHNIASSPFSKKLQGILKGKKPHNFKRQRKHQSQTQIRQEWWNYQTTNFKTPIINMLRALMEKVDNMQE